MRNCVLCKIIEGELPSFKIYEDSKFLAILDIHPAAKGHALIFSKNHYEHFTEVPDTLLVEWIKIIKKVATALVKATKSQSFNIIENDGRIAGQLIPHVHFHIIPRSKDDGIRIDKWTGMKYEDKEVKEAMNSIRKAMAE